MIPLTLVIGNTSSSTYTNKGARQGCDGGQV